MFSESLTHDCMDVVITFIRIGMVNTSKAQFVCNTLVVNLTLCTRVTVLTTTIHSFVHNNNGMRGERSAFNTQLW